MITVCLDAGHGGEPREELIPPSDGSATPEQLRAWQRECHKTRGTEHNGIVEKDYSLDMVGLVASKLEGAQVDVVFTRTTDEYLSLGARGEIALVAGADLALTFHANASPDERIRGLMAMHWPSNHDGREVALTIARSVRDRAIPLYHKNPVWAAAQGQEWLAGSRNVLSKYPMTSVLVEMFHATNPEAAAYALTDEGRERIADAIVAGVERFAQLQRSQSA